MTIVELFARRLTSDPAAPLVTYYDEVTGERVELSATSFDNWVAKTANLLRDELLIDDGDLVRLDLPLHWQSLVWVQAVWTAGGVVELGATADATTSHPAVTVTTLAKAPSAAGEEVVVLSLRPLGLPCAEPLPAGAHDYAVVVPGHGDRFAHQAPATGAPALSVAGEVRTHDELLAAASKSALPPGGRVMVQGGLSSLSDLLAAWVRPISANGSVVVVAGSDDPERLQRIASDERVTTPAP